MLLDGNALLDLTHALAAGHGNASRVEVTLRRMLSTATQPLALLDQLPLERPDTGGGLSYELALKLYCDDPGVIGRLHSQFASRATQILSRVQEAVTEGNLRRAARDAHSLRGMAIYIGSPPIALAAQALESSAAANDRNAVEQQVNWLVNEVRTLGASLGRGRAASGRAASDGGSEHNANGRAADEAEPSNVEANVPADSLINALLHRNIQYAIDRLSCAAARGDTEAMHAGTLALKQMCLCHGHTFDLLAAAAYQLQRAIASGNAATAMSYVEPAIEAGGKMLQLLLLESATPPMFCSLRELPGCSFFSHVLSMPVADSSSSNASSSEAAMTAHGGGPPILPRAAANFSGDQVVFSYIGSAFVQLIPVWLRSVEAALNNLNLVMLNCEAWILASTARLVGAQRLVALAEELTRAIKSSRSQNALRRILLSIKDEARLVLCFLAQERPRQLLPPPAAAPTPAPAPAPSPRDLVLSSAPVPYEVVPALPAFVTAPAPVMNLASQTPPSRTSLALSPGSAVSAVSGGGTPSGSRAVMAGVPIKALRYLTDTALELASNVAASRTALDEDIVMTAETLNAAAEMVNELLARSQRRLSMPRPIPAL
jgi:HPt (histidine-containing phosphotransfer) domain-containing protein